MNFFISKLHKFLYRHKTIKVMGTFRSGSNLAKYLLEDNLDCRVVFSELSWKHAIAPTLFLNDKPLEWDFPTVLTYKDPVAFCISVFQFWHKTRPELNPPTDFSEFIRHQFIVYDNSIKGLPRYRFDNPVQYWNQYHYSYLNWARLKPNLHLLSLDSLLSQPQAAIESIAGQFALSYRAKADFSLPETKVLPSDDSQESRVSDSEIQQKRALKVEAGDVEHILALTDDDVLEGLSLDGLQLLSRYNLSSNNPNV